MTGSEGSVVGIDGGFPQFHERKGLGVLAPGWGWFGFLRFVGSFVKEQSVIVGGGGVFGLLGGRSRMGAHR